jgi:ferrochelatase
MTAPFDAVLVISFGGPAGLEDVRPFLENVLRGRRVPPQRVEEVVRHYAHFNGVSPLTELTMRQAGGLEHRLRERGLNLPVYVGMRNWHPFLPDTFKAMSAAGVRRAIGFITSPQHSVSGCTQYKEDVCDTRRALVSHGLTDVAVTYVDSWYDHPGFIAAAAKHVTAALETLDGSLRDRARLVFTQHSLPIAMADRCAYVEQTLTTCRLIADEVGRHDWVLAYQSRSGRPTDPWLGPDIRDYLRAAHGEGLAAAVIVPVGFICDHMEVVWDLDVEVLGLCRELGLPVARAETANDDPLFVDMMADVVQRKFEQYARFPVLPIVSPA